MSAAAAAAAAMAALHRNPKPLNPLLRRLLSTQTLTPTTPPTPTTPDEISRVKSAIRCAATPDALCSLFLSGLPLPHFLSDRPLFSFAVRRLAADGRRDLVSQLLSSSLSSSPNPPSEGFLIRLISLYSSASMPDHSLEVFRLVKPPSDRALAALLSAFHDNRQFDRAITTFRTLPSELGIAPGIVSHNILLKSLVASGDLAGARKVFDEMPDKAGVKPDIVSCNVILNGYLKAGDEAAFEEFLKEISRRHLKPNAGTYNLRMAALCSKGRSFEAEEMLDAMGKRGVMPNRANFNTLIEGFCKEGEVGAAMAVFRRMPEVARPNGTGVSPSFETYIMLIRALVEKGVFGPAVEVCKECLEKKWAPPFQAVKGLVEGLVKGKQVEKAREVVTAMRKSVKGDAAEEWKKVEAAFSL